MSMQEDAAHVTQTISPSMKEPKLNLPNRWQDFKRRLKDKISEHRRHARMTGGGPPATLELTPLETRALASLDAEMVQGVGRIDTGRSPAAIEPITATGPNTAEEISEDELVEEPRDVEEHQMSEEPDVSERESLHACYHSIRDTNATIESNTTDIATTLTRMEHTLHSSLTRIESTMDLNLSSINTTLTRVTDLIAVKWKLDAAGNKEKGAIYGTEGEYSMSFFAQE
ncbi:uncharacterized protein LOC142159489 [Mixophyes fleayi]|uniref:uncharacterized protein LOC142159489 n=1 Tax=Mixophyes fleayi TaxID=3061075 RepID=UPI003F4D7330